MMDVSRENVSAYHIGAGDVRRAPGSAVQRTHSAVHCYAWFKGITGPITGESSEIVK